MNDSDFEKIQKDFSEVTDLEKKFEILRNIFPSKDGVGGFGGSRGGGRRTFQDGVTYTLVDFVLTSFNDNPYVEVHFSGSDGIGVKTSLGFWRKSVAMKPGPAKGNEYESTEFPFNGSDELFLRTLQTKSFVCTSGRAVTTSVEWKQESKSYVTGKARKTWLYTFAWA